MEKLGFSHALQQCLDQVANPNNWPSDGVGMVVKNGQKFEAGTHKIVRKRLVYGLRATHQLTKATLK